MEIDGEYKTDYWRHVILNRRSNNGRVGERGIHNHKVEIQNLADEILEELEELQQNQTGMRADPDFDDSDLEGLPDESIVPRDYTHKVVSLFALSCGIMEEQLGILLTLDLIPESRRDGYVDEELNDLNLVNKLNLAESAEVIDDGTYSEAWDVRKTRNNLVHSPVYRLTIENYDSHRGRINKAVSAPDKIDQAIQEQL